MLEFQENRETNEYEPVALKVIKCTTKPAMSKVLKGAIAAVF